MKTGIVVEGGGMRGIYAAGVLDVLWEHGVKADGLIGVSAGAINGCGFVSGQAGRSIRYNLKYCRDPRYMSFRSLVRTGDIVGSDFCYRQLPELLDPFDNDGFEASPMEFYAACTDVETGKPVYHRCDSLRGSNMDWIRASASMPLVSRIVEIDGQKLLDGGVADSIPAAAFSRMGFKKNLVILTRPESYRKKPNRMIHIMRRVYRRYPEFIRAMERRHLMYNRELDEIKRMEAAGEIYVIRPSRLIKISRTEKRPEKIQEMYDLGREDGGRALREAAAFLEGVNSKEDGHGEDNPFTGRSQIVRGQHGSKARGAGSDETAKGRFNGYASGL